MRGNFSLEFIENRIAVFQILSLAQPDKEKAAGSTQCRGGHAKSAADAVQLSVTSASRQDV